MTEEPATRLPIRHAVALTGSVNQLGAVQPIGGVNETIEGFFDVCRVRDVAGAHGVLIPAANVGNLMLRSDVVEAATVDRFSVWAASTVDEAIELLTGVPAGMQLPDGGWPDRVGQRPGRATTRRARRTCPQLPRRSLGRSLEPNPGTEA